MIIPPQILQSLGLHSHGDHGEGGHDDHGHGDEEEEEEMSESQRRNITIFITVGVYVFLLFEKALHLVIPHQKSHVSILSLILIIGLLLIFQVCGLE